MGIQMLVPIITNWSRQHMVTSHKKFFFSMYFFYKVCIYSVCICILYIPRHAYSLDITQPYIVSKVTGLHLILTTMITLQAIVTLKSVTPHFISYKYVFRKCTMHL